MSRTADPTVHEALLEASRTEFARKGLEHAKVEDIARRAGISKGAFYLHYRTKEDAFGEILQRFLGVLEDHARERHESECRFEEALRASGGGDLEEALEFECQADVELLELLWRNRQILAALDGAGGERSARLVGAFRSRIRALVATRITGRQAGGHLRRDIDPEVVADLVVGAYEDFGRRMIQMKARPDLAGWARSLLRVLYEGMLDRQGARRAPAARSGRRRAG
jgi:AcrR family transcriptional regulator